MRLMECVRLRVKDVEFERREIVVRAGKGDKDRVTMLPASLADRLKAHIAVVKKQHDADLVSGRGEVCAQQGRARGGESVGSVSFRLPGR